MRETQVNKMLRKLADSQRFYTLSETARRAGIDYGRLKGFYRRSVNELYPEEYTKLERVL